MLTQDYLQSDGSNSVLEWLGGGPKFVVGVIRDSRHQVHSINQAYLQMKYLATMVAGSKIVATEYLVVVILVLTLSGMEDVNVKYCNKQVMIHLLM